MNPLDEMLIVVLSVLAFVTWLFVFVLVFIGG